MFLWPDLARCLDAGEGARVDQALEVAGEDRAVEAPGGGAALARGGLLNESSHKMRPITVYKPWEVRFGQLFAMVLIIDGEV